MGDALMHESLAESLRSVAPAKYVKIDKHRKDATFFPSRQAIGQIFLPGAAFFLLGKAILPLLCLPLPWKQQYLSMRKELGKWLMDISKYIVTAVVLSSIFGDLNEKWMIYVGGVVATLLTLIFGLLLQREKKN